MSVVLLPEEALDSYIRSYIRKIYQKMKNSIVLALLSLCLIGKAQTYPSLNISLLAHIDPEKDNTGLDGRKYSGCWGWVQPVTHTEYAIVGTSSQTYFINLAFDAMNKKRGLIFVEGDKVEAACATGDDHLLGPEALSRLTKDSETEVAVFSVYRQANAASWLLEI